jgi:hypothetical protein
MGSLKIGSVISGVSGKVGLVLIDFAQVLIDGIDVRNILSHNYDEDEFEASEKKIRKEIFPAIEKMRSFFVDIIGKQRTLF